MLRAGLFALWRMENPDISHAENPHSWSKSRLDLTPMRPPSARSSHSKRPRGLGCPCRRGAPPPHLGSRTLRETPYLGTVRTSLRYLDARRLLTALPAGQENPL